MDESGHGVGDVGSRRAEAERLAAENGVLRNRVTELEGQVGALAEKVAMLAKPAFGTSSEKAAARTRGPGGSPLDPPRTASVVG